MYWLKNKSYDLSFIVLSPLLSLILFCIYIYAGQPIAWALPIYVFFSAILDQPHIFLTFTRTHLDAFEFKRHILLHTLGFTIILLGCYWAIKNHEHAYFFALQLLGSYHIFRQNSGFFRLYAHPMAQKIKRQILEYAYALFFIFSITSSVLAAYFSISPVLMIYVAATLLSAILLFSWRDWKNPGVVLIVLSSVVNWITYHNIEHELVATAVETAYHDIQYFAFMFLYMQRSQKKTAAYTKKAFAFVILGGLVAAYLTDIKQPMLVYNNWAILMLGIITYHYIAEAFIWRFRSQDELSSILNTQTNSSKTAPTSPKLSA